MIHGNLVEGLIERVDGSPQEAEEAVESRREGGHAAASIVYETHSLSTDNDLGFATGWKEGQLSEQGRVLAKELGQRRLHDGIDAVFVSDLGRAVETAKIAFLDSKLPVYFDSRLRECNYGDWNGAPVAKIASTRSKYIFQRYPNGQSYTDVVGVMAGFLVDLATNWGGHRVLIVGPTKINLAKTAVESGLWPIRHLGADK